MKDWYKKPVFYYVAVPVVLMVWPMVLWLYYLPNVENRCQQEQDYFKKAWGLIAKVVVMDPARLELAGKDENSKDFDYAVAVDSAASRCQIPSTNYKISSKRLVSSKGQKSQSAMVVLEDVEIEKMARFISGIQTQWANLECTSIKLTKKQGVKNSWKIDLDFKYFF
jgi:hypothetical protein